MPGVSTPTIVYKYHSIGMGIEILYDASEPNMPPDKAKSKWATDSYRYYTGFRYKYNQFGPNDISQEKADELCSQYPHLQRQIQEIIENRRRYYERTLRQQNSKCTIL